jgi:hypothetical protein
VAGTSAVRPCASSHRRCSVRWLSLHTTPADTGTVLAVVPRDRCRRSSGTSIGLRRHGPLSWPASRPASRASRPAVDRPRTASCCSWRGSGAASSFWPGRPHRSRAHCGGGRLRRPTPLQPGTSALLRDDPGTIPNHHRAITESFISAGDEAMGPQAD